jgi:hypothetical protein
MSTAIDDFTCQAVLGVSVPPGSYDDVFTGAAVDLLAGDGRGFAVLQADGLTGGASVAGQIEESDDGTTWAAITGAAFPTVTANGAYAVGFARSRRYVRCALGVVVGANVCVTVGQQRKVV